MEAFTWIGSLMCHVSLMLQLGLGSTGVFKWEPGPPKTPAYLSLFLFAQMSRVDIIFWAHHVFLGWTDFPEPEPRTKHSNLKWRPLLVVFWIHLCLEILLTDMAERFENIILLLLFVVFHFCQSICLQKSPWSFCDHPSHGTFLFWNSSLSHYVRTCTWIRTP